MKKLRQLLIFLGLVLTILLVIDSRSYIDRADHFFKTMPTSWWLAIILAILAQLAGHVLRTLRSKTVIDVVRQGSWIDQFGALSAGYLFNALLPLRLGEIVRTVLIGKRLRISLLYTFAVIAMERSIDLIFIGIIVIATSIFIGGKVATILLLGAAGAIIVATIIIVGLALLVKENHFLLNKIWRLSNLLNPTVSNSLRFKVWSLIFGMQQFIRRRYAVKKYLLLSIASWACYLTSTLILVLVILGERGIVKNVVLTTAPYTAISAPSAPADITHYSNLISPIVKDSSSPSQTNIVPYIIVSWSVLTLPMMLIGYTALVWLKFKPLPRTKSMSNEDFANKLLRREDISQEFPTFLDTYFLGQNLTRVLHKIEVTGELSLVKFFKGGSNAITMLAISGDKLFVKKIVPPEYRDRLRNQYLWLKKHKDLSAIVGVSGEQTTDSYYAIDIDYNPNTAAFFEYLHDRPLKDATAVIDSVWNILYGRVYKLAPIAQHPKQRDRYIQDRLIDKLDQAASVSGDLNAAMLSDKIKINGEVYDNFHVVMERIKNNTRAWKDLATYRSSKAIHGDLTIDNILVDLNNNRPLLIDPSDDNQIRGPIIDFSRLMQSLLAGYETLINDNDPVNLERDGTMPNIHYRNIRSARYMQLSDHVMRNIVFKRLSVAEQRSLLFHVGTFYGRMLPHRVVINPDNVLKFYAVSIYYLNNFIDQYD